MENSTGTIGNRIRDLPASSAILYTLTLVLAHSYLQITFILTATKKFRIARLPPVLICLRNTTSGLGSPHSRGF
jgi:hypothetical protein